MFVCYQLHNYANLQHNKGGMLPKQHNTQHALLVCLVKVSQQGAYQWRFLRLQYIDNILNALSVTGLYKTVLNNISICNSIEYRLMLGNIFNNQGIYLFYVCSKLQPNNNVRVIPFIHNPFLSTQLILHILLHCQHSSFSS